MPQHLYRRLLLVALTFALLCQCSKSSGPLNITLYNKDLPTIQRYVTGKWRIAYYEGGFVYTKVVPTHNEYITISAKRFLYETDSLGKVIDTVAYWPRVSWFGSLQDSTYLLSYHNWPTTGKLSVNFLVDGITNDTLKLRQFVSEPTYYYLIQAK